MKRSILFFSILFISFSLYAASVQVQKKNNSKTVCADYTQVIINDTDFNVTISLLNEETHFFDEYVLEPNKITILTERLYVSPSGSKKLMIKNPYIYISSMEFISENQIVYLLKGTKRNPDGYKYSQDNDWNYSDDEVEEVYVIENTIKKENSKNFTEYTENTDNNPLPNDLEDTSNIENTNAIEDTNEKSFETIQADYSGYIDSATVESADSKDLPAPADSILPEIPEDSMSSAISTDSIDSTDLPAPADSILPEIPEDSMSSAISTDSTDSTDSIDSTNSTDSTPSSTPSAPAEFQESNKSVESVESVENSLESPLESVENPPVSPLSDEFLQSEEPEFYYNDPSEEVLEL